VYCDSRLRPSRYLLLYCGSSNSKGLVLFASSLWLSRFKNLKVRTFLLWLFMFKEPHVTWFILYLLLSRLICCCDPAKLNLLFAAVTLPNWTYYPTPPDLVELCKWFSTVSERGGSNSKYWLKMRHVPNFGIIPLCLLIDICFYYRYDDKNDVEICRNWISAETSILSHVFLSPFIRIIL